MNIRKGYFLFLICISVGCISTRVTPQSYIDSLNQHRAAYKSDFQNNPRGPLKTDEDIALMDFYEPNINYVSNCNFIKAENPKTIVMATYSGNKKDFIVYGTARCKVEDEDFTLTLYQNAQNFGHPLYKNHLFLPFKDFTNGKSTYGGGRYLDLSIDSIKNNLVTIDFNHAYNPWCAYADGYNCPIPPIENHLQLEVKAGEKNYKGDTKH